MSRVKKPGNKFVNTTKYDHTVTDAGPVICYKLEGADYRKAKSLKSWLFLKYDMSYKTYRNKSKQRREQLREECMRDTGIMYFTEQERREATADAYELLESIGMPFDPMGNPLIG